jgi:hypothetical protein
LSQCKKDTLAGWQFPGDLKEITREHAVRVLGLWGSSIFRPSFARFSADSAGDTMTGLQPGTLGKMLDLGRWRIDRPLVGGLDYRTRRHER